MELLVEKYPQFFGYQKVTNEDDLAGKTKSFPDTTPKHDDIVKPQTAKEEDQIDSNKIDSNVDITN